MLNFSGLLKAPDLVAAPVYIATYSDGKALQREPITALRREAAHDLAVRRTPTGFALTGLRKKKAPRPIPLPSLRDRVDVALTRLLDSVHRNTDCAARFALDDLKNQARRAMP